MMMMANRKKRTRARSSSGETRRTERTRSHSWSADEEGNDVHKRGYRSSSTSDIINNNNRSNSRGRSRRRGRSRSWFYNKSAAKKRKDDSTSRRRRRRPRCSTLFLSSPPGTVSSPRLDIWVVFSASSCACLVSLGTLHANSSRSSDFTGWDILALITCCISFIIGLAMALGMRIGPSRMCFTKPLGRRREAGRSCVADVTLELLSLSFLLLLWTLSISTLVDGTRTGGGGYDSDTIWNANLFYSSWTTFLLCTYLWVEVLTLTDRGGVITIAKTHEERLPLNTFTKRWTLLIIVSLVIFSASIATYTSPMCRGSLLKSTSYCSRSMSGILIGGLFQCFLVVCVTILYRLSHMRRRNNRAIRGDEARDEQRIVSVRIRDRGSCIIALVSLIVQCIHVALITSPTGGGPGNVSGTLYFGAWLGFVSSFELCLRYLEFYTTAITISTAADDDVNDISNSVRVDHREGSYLDDVTVYEESKSEDAPSRNAFQDKRKDSTSTLNDLMNGIPSSNFPETFDASLPNIGGKEKNWPLPTAGRDPVATPEAPIKQSIQVKDSTRRVKRNRRDSPSRPTTQHRKDGRPSITTNSSFRPDPVPANNNEQMLPSKSRSVRPTTQQRKNGRPKVTTREPLRPDPAETNNKRSNRHKPELPSVKVDRTSSATQRENMIRHLLDKNNIHDHHLPKVPSVSINVHRSTSIRVEELTSYPTVEMKELSLLRKNTESLKASPSKQYTHSNKDGRDITDPEETRSNCSIPFDREISLHSSIVSSLDSSGETKSSLDSMDDTKSNSLDKPVTRRIPPPPPLFRRTPTPESGHYPLLSIHTSQGKSFMSEPTLDSGLATFFPKPSTESTRRSTDSTYEKKLSDETERHDSYSEDDDDSLRLEPGDNKKVVDSIVAAALAYAEKSNSAPVRASVSSSKRASVSTTATTSKSVRSMYSEILMNGEDSSLDEQYDC